MKHKRRVTVTKKEIENVLGIPGYKIYLPITWKMHGQRRMIVYAKEDLNVSEKAHGEEFSDLPILTFEIAFSKEKKTQVNFFYREFSNGVTGLTTLQDQTQGLNRMIKLWTILASSNKDLVCLGDANLCAMKWNEEDY